MAIDVTTLQAFLDTGNTAMAAGDFDAAELAAVQAQTCLAGLSDGEADGVKVAWREGQIRDLLASIRTMRQTRQVAARGLVRIPVKYVESAT